MDRVFGEKNNRKVLTVSVHDPSKGDLCHADVILHSQFFFFFFESYFILICGLGQMVESVHDVL